MIGAILRRKKRICSMMLWSIMLNADANRKDEATITKYEDGWLSEETKNKVRKLENLAQQLSR